MCCQRHGIEMAVHMASAPHPMLIAFHVRFIIVLKKGSISGKVIPSFTSTTWNDVILDEGGFQGPRDNIMGHFGMPQS